MPDTAKQTKPSGINPRLYDALVKAMTPELKAALQECAATAQDVVERETKARERVAAAKDAA